MTTREVYEALLIELNKNFGSPDLLLEDFNHFINKGIFQWVQKRYNVYDSNQQTTDDVQVLVTNQVIPGNTDYEVAAAGKLSVENKGNNYRFSGALNSSYCHMLSCLLEYKVMEDFKCYKKDSIFIMPAKRITAEKESVVLTNAWLKPTYRHPYYKVSSSGWEDNVNRDTTPGSKVTVSFGPDAYIPLGSSTPTGVFELANVHCEYIRYPEAICLTYDDLDTLSDESDVMEFKDDVCHEIIKETVKLIALNTGNPILQSYDAVNMSVPPQGGVQDQQ